MINQIYIKIKNIDRLKQEEKKWVLCQAHKIYGFKGLKDTKM